MMSILTRTTNNDGSTKEVIITRHGLATKNKINSAYKLDDEIKHMVEELENELEEKYKNKPVNVLNKYYFVGNKLKKFIDNLNLPKGEKQYIWQSINFHSKSLALSESNTRLTRDKASKNTWLYCYNLSHFKKQDVFEYNWTQWVEIFDSKITTEDVRVIYWLINIKKKYFEKGSLQLWFRTLMKIIRNEIHIKHNIITTLLSDSELNNELDNCFKIAIKMWNKK